MLNPLHLHTLAVIVETGSFASAARQLGYTGSAVSQQMSQLERQLRTPLFERSAHSVRPTAVAMQIVERAASTLSALEVLADDVDLIVGGRKGRLRIGSFPTASEHLLPDAISGLRRTRPLVDVHLDEGEPRETLRMLESRELDVCLVYRYLGTPQRWPRSITLRRVLTEEVLLMRPTGVATGVEEVRLEDIAGETWISTGEGTSMAANLQQLMRTRGLDLTVAYRSNNYAVIQGLVRKGLGVALVPAMAVTSRRGVVVSRLADHDLRREVLLASAPTAVPDLVDAFEASVRQAASRLLDPAGGIALIE